MKLLVSADSSIYVFPCKTFIILAQNLPETIQIPEKNT